MSTPKCCEITDEEQALLDAGEYTPEELWGGSLPTCPKCIKQPLHPHNDGLDEYRQPVHVGELDPAQRLALERGEKWEE